MELHGRRFAGKVDEIRLWAEREAANCGGPRSEAHRLLHTPFNY